VSKAGQIVFCTLEGYVHSLALNGELLWNFTTVGAPLGPPAGDDRGRVLVVTQAGHIHAIHSDGTTAFNYRVPVSITSPGTWSPRGFLAFAGLDNHLWAYSPRAGLLWRARLPAPMTVAPAVMADGELRLTTQGGGVWRMRGRRLTERLPDSATPEQGSTGKVAEPKSTRADRVCRQPLLESPIAGELYLSDRVVVWSHAGRLAALTPENLALACP
jgi:outer membrane protein assembly factor BamB